MPQPGDRGAVVAAGLLHELMDFQHCKSHGLTQGRARLSGQQHLGLGGLWGPLLLSWAAGTGEVTGKSSGRMLWAEACTPGI